MVKLQKKDITNSLASKGFEEGGQRARKINASTRFETCTEQISPFGGLLGLIKFLDLIQFEEVFNHRYIAPRRKVKLGNDRMVIGIIMLLFIGFNRLWHFTYIRLDAIICGFFQLTRLPAASTFWRYVDSLGINQAHSFLKIMAVLRERVWQLCGLTYETIHLSTDTTVEALYGDQQGEAAKAIIQKTVVKKAIALSFALSMKPENTSLENFEKEKPLAAKKLPSSSKRSKDNSRVASRKRCLEETGNSSAGKAPLPA